MDLTFSESEPRSATSCAPGSQANDPGAEPDATRTRSYAWRRDWQRTLLRGRLGRRPLAREYGGRGATLTRVGDLLRGARPRARAAAGERARASCWPARR